MNGVFSMCTKLKVLPNIGKWSTENVKEMIGMFNECSSLENIQDLGKWNVSNVNNASAMFYKCEKLKSLPNGLNNWKFKEFVIMEKIFDNCPCNNKDAIMSCWKKS
jgi:surface protein